MSGWYESLVEGGSLRIEFKPSEHRYWPPEVIKSLSLPTAEVKGRDVTLTGAGAVWMYAHAASTLKSAGALSITVSTKGAPGESMDLAGSSCRLIPTTAVPSRALLSIHLRPNPPVAEQAVLQLLQEPLEQLVAMRPRELCVTGRAGVRAYATIAERAVAFGIELITCWTPVDGLVVIFDRRGEQVGNRVPVPEWLEAELPAPRSPVIVGVAGNPNVGKSVFSLALDLYRGQIGCLGWRLDCDGQAPTPPWYLSLVRQGDETARTERTANRRDWSPEMTAYIAAQLGRLRRFFDVSIADLPGGNHKVEPPQLIPAGRETVFSQVDALILLDGEDGGTEQAWRKALRAHGLEERIDIVLRSRNPSATPALQLQPKSDVWRGSVEGLSRQYSSEVTVANLRESFDQLWPSLLERASRLKEGS